MQGSGAATGYGGGPDELSWPPHSMNAQATQQGDVPVHNPGHAQPAFPATALFPWTVPTHFLHGNQSALSQATEENKRLQDEVAGLKAVVQAKGQDMAALSGELTKLQKEKKDLDAKIQRRDGSLKDLRSQRKRLEDVRAEAKAQVQNMQLTVNNYKASLETAKGLASALQTDVEALHKEKEKWGSEERRLLDELATVKREAEAERGTPASEMVHLRAEVAGARAQLKEARGQAEKAKQQHQAEVAKLKAEVAGMTGELTQARGQIERAKQQHQAEMAKVTAEATRRLEEEQQPVRKMEGTIKELRKKLAAAGKPTAGGHDDEELERLKTELKEAKKEVMFTHRVHGMSTNRIVELEFKLAAARSEVTSFHRKLVEANKFSPFPIAKKGEVTEEEVRAALAEDNNVRDDRHVKRMHKMITDHLLDRDLVRFFTHWEPGSLNTEHVELVELGKKHGAGIRELLVSKLKLVDEHHVRLPGSREALFGVPPPHPFRSPFAGQSPPQPATEPRGLEVCEALDIAFGRLFDMMPVQDQEGGH